MASSKEAENTTSARIIDLRNYHPNSLPVAALPDPIKTPLIALADIDQLLDDHFAKQAPFE